MFTPRVDNPVQQCCNQQKKNFLQPAGKNFLDAQNKARLHLFCTTGLDDDVQTAGGQHGTYFLIKLVQPKKNFKLIMHFGTAWSNFNKFHGFGAAWSKNNAA